MRSRLNAILNTVWIILATFWITLAIHMGNSFPSGHSTYYFASEFENRFSNWQFSRPIQRAGDVLTSLWITLVKKEKKLEWNAVCSISFCCFFFLALFKCNHNSPSFFLHWILFQALSAPKFNWKCNLSIKHGLSRNHKWAQIRRALTQNS